MLIGLIGAPNKGKSTLFSALTLNDAEIADYPFTTIKPNLGVAYAAKPCVEAELHTKCNPRNSLCVKGIRMMPVNVIDVAGLVEDAHKGRGMGNQFLTDLAQADALILVVDASGQTDSEGAMTGPCDPRDEVHAIKKELNFWVAGIIGRHMQSLSQKADGAAAISEILAGMHLGKDRVEAAMDSLGLQKYRIRWSEEEILRFAEKAVETSKPLIIAANKCDVKGAEGNLEKLKAEFGEDKVVGCSAAIELALRKASKAGIIDYVPGDKSFKALKDGITEVQKHALETMSRFISVKGTGVQELINAAVFLLLDEIVVYPVEDEHRYSDSSGNVLPDAVLLKRGSTAKDLAFRIHTDIGNKMLYAIDAKAKMRIGKDHVLKDGDVIKIVSAA